MQQWIVITRLMALLAPLCFLPGCAGEDSVTPLAQNPQTTQNIHAAASSLVATLNKCRGGVVASMQSAIAGAAQGRKFAPIDDSACWNDMVLSLLLWRQAPKQDGTMALGDPFYRAWMTHTIKRFMNRTAKELALTKEQQLAAFARLFTGFTGQFVPSAQRHGALVSSDVSQILTAIQTQGASLRDFSNPRTAAGALPAPVPGSERRYSLGYFR